MQKYILSLDKNTVKQISDFSQVEQLLTHLDGTKHSLLSLSNEQGRSVEVFGKSEELSISLGNQSDSMKGYYLLGLSKRVEDPVTLSYGGRTISIQKNERLAFEDALLILRCFFESKEYPPAYNMRELNQPLFQ